MEEQMARSDALGHFTQNYMTKFRHLRHLESLQRQLLGQLNLGITRAENIECVKFTIRLMIRKVH